MSVAVCWLCVLQVIFQHYVRDLEAVQAQYEAQKHNPPVPHNVPPTAGNIMWSRQLLSRIEEPMQLFAQNKPLMAMKESKKVIKLYNRVRPSSGAARTTCAYHHHLCAWHQRGFFCTQGGAPEGPWVQGAWGDSWEMLLLLLLCGQLRGQWNVTTVMH
jgi:hypothetical protein